MPSNTSLSSLLLRALCCGLLSTTLTASSPTHAEKKKRTAAEVVRTKGLTLVQSVTADFTGDGKAETMAACTGPEGIDLVALQETDAGPAWQGVAAHFSGTQVKALQAKALVAPAKTAELVIEIQDDTPDEKTKGVHVLMGFPKMREIFSSMIDRAKNEEDRPSWDRNREDTVSYGEARPGWSFEDTDNDGNTEIVVRRRPKILNVARAGKDALQVIVGVTEDVFTFSGDSSSGTYNKSSERYRDFIPSLPVASLHASSAFIPAAELKALTGSQMANELELAPAAASEGKAAKASPAKSAAANKVNVDRSEYIQRAADRDLQTAWIEDAPKTDGAGEWVELKLAQPSAIHAVRLVGGCVATKATYLNHNVPERFSIRLGDMGNDAVVDLKKAKQPDAPVMGILEIPVEKLPFAKQSFVFFDGTAKAGSIRITLDRSRRQGKDNKTCISEVSVH